MRPHDPLDDALDDLRISGSVLLHEAYAPGWAIDVPEEGELRALMKVGNAVRVLPFHLVRQGGVLLSTDTGAELRLDAPDLSMLFGGAAHRLAFGRTRTAIALRDILNGAGPQPAAPGTPDTTELICGAFVTRSAPLNPLLGALPAMFKVSAGGTRASSALAGVAALLASEIGRRSRNSFTAQRLLEVLCAEAVRAYQVDTPVVSAGWFRGLADPKIAEAIRRVHAEPGDSFTVQSLASGVALSPSRFAARFREAMGESVMDYVGRWRANIACRLLLETELPLADIGGKVGYESVAAFGKAFKSRLGAAPATWRAGQR